MGALRNEQNHINALCQGNYEIQFVMHGNGIELLRSVVEENADAASRIDSLRSQGVEFKICKNTLVGRSINLSDHYFAGEEDVVPSGVAEIGKLQRKASSTCVLKHVLTKPDAPHQADDCHEFSVLKHI